MINLSLPMVIVVFLTTIAVHSFIAYGLWKHGRLTWEDSSILALIITLVFLFVGTAVYKHSEDCMTDMECEERYGP